MEFFKGPLADAGLVVHVELSAICNGERPGAPSSLACFLKSKLTDLIDGAQIIPQLRISEERDTGWVLCVDLYCIDDDGGLLDAMVLGLVAALESLVLPRLVWLVNHSSAVVLHCPPPLVCCCKLIPFPFFQGTRRSLLWPVKEEVLAQSLFSPPSPPCSRLCLWTSGSSGIRATKKRRWVERSFLSD